jgi:hypothetical protein
VKRMDELARSYPEDTDNYSVVVLAVVVVDGQHPIVKETFRVLHLHANSMCHLQFSVEDNE